MGVERDGYEHTLVFMHMPTAVCPLVTCLFLWPQSFCVSGARGGIQTKDQASVGGWREEEGIQGKQGFFCSSSWLLLGLRAIFGEGGIVVNWESVPICVSYRGPPALTDRSQSG